MHSRGMHLPTFEVGASISRSGLRMGWRRRRLDQLWRLQALTFHARMAHLNLSKLDAILGTHTETSLLPEPADDVTVDL